MRDLFRQLRRGVLQQVFRSLFGAEHVAEIGGDDGADDHDGGHVGHERSARDVGEVGEHRSVLLEGLIHAVGAECEDAGPHEEHGEDDEQDGGVELRAGDALLGLLAVLRLHVDGELRKRRHVGEGKDQDRKDEEDALEHLAPAIGTIVKMDEAVQVPAWDEVDGGDGQGDNQRVDQHLGQPNHGPAANGETAGHDSDADGGEQPAVDGGPAQLVDDETIHRVGDGDTVDQDGGKDRDPVQHREASSRMSLPWSSLGAPATMRA